MFFELWTSLRDSLFETKQSVFTYKTIKIDFYRNKKYRGRKNYSSPINALKYEVSDYCLM